MANSALLLFLAAAASTSRISKDTPDTPKNPDSLFNIYKISETDFTFNFFIIYATKETSTSPERVAI